MGATPALLSRGRIWMLVRLALVALALVPGRPSAPPEPGGAMLALLGIPAVMALVVSSLLMLLLWAMQGLRPAWHRPSWFRNPFADVAQLLHMGSWFAIAGGASGILVSGDRFEAVLILGMGVGLWVGLRLWLAVLGSLDGPSEPSAAG